ncbi:uncharacterized protein LOC107042482 [Diachasma alloeum]|uniref:uncharacterized protein LOC107042482 n=1 Tax=Diachasma alloeum TaxID=454923 RepID=UPI00073829C5|nr:uncharacterized protein LOC107042482 [Diachasma alloeum]
MAALDATITLQMTRAAFIEETCNEAKGDSAKQLGLSALESKLSLLEKYWDKLESTHEKLVAGGLKMEGLLELSYFKNQVFDQALMRYATAKTAITQLMENKGGPNLNQTMRGGQTEAHSDQLLHPPSMSSHSATELNLLTSSVSEALSTLKALGQPTDQWGPVVVHVIAHQLSNKLREAWENKIGASSEYPSLEQLAELLQGRSRAMETLEVGYPCSYCKGEHYIASCRQFKNLAPAGRKQVVDRLYLCFNCLEKHSIRVCQTTRKCFQYQERHHILLHLDRSRRPAQRDPASQVPLNDAGSQHPSTSAPLTSVPVVTYTHTGVGGTTSGEVHLTLQSIHSEERIEVTAHSLDRLTSTLPSFSAEGLKWDHIDGLELADPHFRVSAPIDLLVEEGFQAPVAQLTSFGWIVYGPAGPDQPASFSSHHLSVSNDELNDLLTKFWVQEEIPGRIDANLSPEELECEHHFRQTHSRDSSGRCVVRLPFSAPVSSLGNSYRPALACLHRMLGRISKDPLFLQLYSEFLKRYEDLDHMRLVTRSIHRSSSSVQAETACRSDEMTLAHEAQASEGLRISEGLQVGPSDAHRSYYLPHHGVVRESSETTKLRVVFNGSAKTSSGNSLSNIFHTGAKLQKDISDVLLWSRQHKVIFMTDIT